jgi:hypothetical protein
LSGRDSRRCAIIGILAASFRAKDCGALHDHGQAAMHRRTSIGCDVVLLATLTLRVTILISVMS